MTVEPLGNYYFDFGKGITSPAGEFTRSSAGFNSTDARPFQYCLDDFGLICSSKGSLSPIHADLEDIAVAVYLSDRRAPRRLTSRPSLAYDEGWPRRIHISVPVRVPVLWCTERVVASLTTLLWRMTGDEWNFVFPQRRIDGRATEMQRQLVITEPGEPATAILHSGGIDSALGMLEMCLSRPAHSLVGISVISNDRLRSVQRAVVQDLRCREDLGNPIEWVQVNLNFTDSKEDRNEREPSQRSRGFLYLTLGSIMAHRVGTKELVVAENGVGAIGLPYTFDQMGAMTNRSCHPQVLMMFEDYFHAVVGELIRIWNPALWLTKAEYYHSVSSFAGTSLLSIVRKTVSCDRFPWVAEDHPCGSCTSCLLRRISGTAAGVGFDDPDSTRYEYDVHSPESPLTIENSAALQAINFQAQRFRFALERDEPFKFLINDFSELLDLMSCNRRLNLTMVQFEQRMVQLLQHHVDEVDQFVASIQRPGWGLPVDHQRIAPTEHRDAS